MGLGAVWCRIYPISERVAQFSKMLHLPSDIVPMACVCIGYPAGETIPKDKWHPEYSHYNSWTDASSGATWHPEECPYPLNIFYEKMKKYFAGSDFIRNFAS